MDIRRGASLQEENGLNIQGNWIPVTPGKPVPTTISGRTNWHEVNGLGAQFSQGNPISNGAVSVLNSMSSVDQNTGLNNLGAVLTGKKRSSDHIVGSNAQAVKNQSARWNYKRYADLLALTNTMVSEASATASSLAQRGNNNAAGSPLPMSYAQIQSSRQQFNSGGMPHLDQNFSMSSNLSNRSCPPQIPYYGFPVPYHRKYNDNSSNRTIADAVSNGTISFQLTPVTPDKSKEVQNKQKSEVANGFLNQRSNQQTNMVQDGIERKRKNAIKVHCIESLVQTNVNSSSAPSESVSQPVMDPSSAVLSTPLEANQNPEKGEENGVDPNKEAEHKPKRKKHRPRVVREGKPKRTPKPKVEKANTKEKRKYVRKNGTKASNTPSADVVGVSTDPTPRTNVKSCKRSLKFNLEGEVRDEGQEGLLHGCVNSSSCRLACNANSATQAQDLCNGTNGMSGHKSTVTLTQGPEVIVEKSPAGIVFDLNHSFTQMPDDISLPEKQAPTTPQPARIVLPKIIAWNVNDKVTTDVHQHSGKKDYPQTLQNMNVEGVRHAVLQAENGYNHKNEVHSKLQSSGHSISKSLNNLNCNQHVVLVEDEQAKGSKRGHCHVTGDTNVRSINLLRSHFISLPENGYDHKYAVQSKLQSSGHSISKSLNNSNCNQHVVMAGDEQAKGSKMGHCHAMGETNVRSINLLGSRFISLPENGYDHKNEVLPKLQSSGHSISRSLNNLNCNQHVALVEDEQAKGSKRGHCHATGETNVRSINLIGSRFNSLPVYQEILRGNEYQRNNGNVGLHFSEIYKKRKTEVAQNKVMSSTPSSMATMENGARQATAYRENHTNPNLCTKNLKNGASNSIHELYSQSMAAGHHCRVQSIPAEVLSRIEAQSRASLDKLQASEILRNIGQTGIMMKKLPKGPTQVHDLASLTTNADRNTIPSTPPKTAPISGYRQGIEIFRTPQALETLAVDNHEASRKQCNGGLALVNKVSHYSANEVKLHGRDHWQSLTKSRGSSDAGPLELARPFNISIVDEIIQRLNCLNINGGTNMILAQEQKALIPFGGDSRMVPYEGPFDPSKKRPPRPKVDLDQETERVWKFLMGKESNNGDEGTDAVKEKWWEEERRVFRGRADSFIARMHLIQGDRRFTEWKGSVVDSVIGVFLTQNVSDHLSSSAFMSLAARFPLQSTGNNTPCYKEGTDMYVEEPEVCILDSNDPGGSPEDNPKSEKLDICENGLSECHELQQNRKDDKTTGAGCASLVEADRIAIEDLVSSQSSDVSSQNSIDSTILRTTERTMNARMGNANSADTKDRSEPEDVVSSLNFVNSSIPPTAETIRSCSDSYSETEDPVFESISNSLNGSTSFMELLQMAGTTMLQENFGYGSGGIGLPFTQGPIIPTSNYSLHITPNTGVLEVEFPEVLEDKSRFSLPLNASGITQIDDVDRMNKRIGPVAGSVTEPTTQQKVKLSTNHSLSSSKQSVQTLIDSGHQNFHEKQLHSCNNLHGDVKAFQHEDTPTAEPKISVDKLDQRGNSSIQQAYLNLPNFSVETLDVLESTCLEDKQKPIENKVVESSNSKQQKYSSEKARTGETTETLKEKGKFNREKNNAPDWDSIRKEVFRKSPKKERSSDRMDSLDWEAVRCADVNVIADTIKERGMNNMLAERIKAFLNRCVRDHEKIDLEWLRDAPPDKAKEYLLSVRGLGLKSVECVRLLTLHHLAFPVDTNVGRIAVRLGWVPLQPLPESVQLHLLEMYPILESIQKYLWPRLCTLDQRTLYELHYQMITFGKVFCTKSKPNCNACPMRAECKHFASAFASARLALPGPEEKGIVSSTAPIATNENPGVGINRVPILQLEANKHLETRSIINKSEPFIELPASPDPECTEIPESDIEDALFYEDPEEIPTIKLNFKEFALNLQSYMQENNMELQEGDMSKALVALTPDATSIPTPKLKNVSRLRTEHQVYELPDSHPLLKGVERRVPGDICSYLLAIWTPGETAESIQPPERCCSSQISGDLCKEKTCFSCNSIREANSQKVRGTLLIPCKTAMRGSFPLNGTYFQVNEVFADHDSSLNPIDVPSAWIWNLPKRTVYFGTSVTTIFKGQSTEEIQSCFWKGYVCVRGFDQKTRTPRPLMARLHFPASKLAMATKLAKKKTKPAEV